MKLMMQTVVILVACLSIIEKTVLGQLPGPDPGPSPGPDGGGGGGGGMPFIMPSIIPLGPAGAPGGQGMQLPEASPEQTACFQAFVDKGMQTCLQDIGNSFQTQKLSLAPPCCDFLNNVDTACKPVIHFENPFFQALVKDHCNGGGTPSTAPSDASGGTPPASPTDASPASPTDAGGGTPPAAPTDSGPASPTDAGGVAPSAAPPGGTSGGATGAGAPSSSSSSAGESAPLPDE